MQNQSKIYHILILLIVCWFSFFYNNSKQAVGIMEARNLVTAREMVAYDNWLIPTMNGELRMEKPPLPTWVAGLIEKASPDNLPLQRGAAGLMSLILVFFLYHFVKRLSGDSILALLSALVVSTSLYVIIIGRLATWDIYCHSFMLGAIYFLYRALSREGKCWKEFAAAGIFAGLSFLSKGPVSFYALLLPFIISYVVVYRPSVRGKILPLFTMIAITVILSIWQPLYLYFEHYEEFISTMTQETDAWVNRSVKPWYRYLSFPIQSGLWTVFLTFSLILPCLRKNDKPDKGNKLVILWTLLAVFLLSLIPEKKERYLFPVLIPAAVATAYYLRYIFGKIGDGSLSKRERILFSTAVYIPMVLCIVAPLVNYILFYSRGNISLSQYIISSLLFIFCAVSLIYSLKANKVRLLTAGLVSIMLTVQIFLFTGITASIEDNKGPKIDEINKMQNVAQLPFYTDKDIRKEIVYLAGRRILVWDFSEGKLPCGTKPFVLVSNDNPYTVLPTVIKDNSDIEIITAYNNSRRNKYDNQFITYLSVIHPKS